MYFLTCVICKEEQYVTEKYSLKCKKEKLLQCLTENASVKKTNKVFQGALHHLYKTNKMFCNIVIECKIINCGEILNMNKLLKNSKNIMEKNEENTDIDNHQLKCWLLRDYPQIIFVKLKQRNMSELVLCQ